MNRNTGCAPGNLRDLRGGELGLGNLRVLTPAQCLEEWK